MSARSSRRDPISITEALDLDMSGTEAHCRCIGYVYGCDCDGCKRREDHAHAPKMIAQPWTTWTTNAMGR